MAYIDLAEKTWSEGMSDEPSEDSGTMQWEQTDKLAALARAWEKWEIKPAKTRSSKPKHDAWEILVDTLNEKVDQRRSLFLSFHHETRGEKHGEKSEELEQRFRRLADEWYIKTSHMSSSSKAAMHSSYQQIIGMGPSALPLIMRELERTRDHWGWALFAITGEHPVATGRTSTYPEAVDAWLEWGKQHGCLLSA